MGWVMVGEEVFVMDGLRFKGGMGLDCSRCRVITLADRRDRTEWDFWYIIGRYIYIYCTGISWHHTTRSGIHCLVHSRSNLRSVLCTLHNQATPSSSITLASSPTIPYRFACPTTSIPVIPCPSPCP